MHIQMERLYQAAKELRGIEGLSEVALALDQSPQTVNNWERRGMSKIGALKAQTAFGCSATWLLTGEGSMRLPEGQTQAEDVAAPTDPRNTRGFARIRIIESQPTVPIRFVKLKLRAGATGVAGEFEPDDGGIYELPAEVVTQIGIEPQWLLAVRVKGDSMWPMMFDQEIVVVSRKNIQLVDGRIYALNFDGEPLIKQLIQKGKEWYLHSFNHKFGDVNVRSGQCDIIGEVVWQAGRSLRAHL